jgi:hypothetical protein|nr:MAG TPA: hypothetical protein [Caudoviricetes sp.]
MKVKDFEEAIMALNNRIRIDEMIINKGSVRKVIAHTELMILMWDSYGRGYSAARDNAPKEYLSFDEYGRLCVSEALSVSRDAAFDLNFE